MTYVVKNPDIISWIVDVTTLVNKDDYDYVCFSSPLKKEV